MDRLVVAAAIVAAVAVFALAVRRRRGVDPPTQARSYATPAQLDRDDFPHRDRPWLVVTFTSATCESCADVVAKAAVLASPQVGVADVEYRAERALHARYAIDAVPTLVVADADGVVRAAFIGRVTATDLWAALAEAREPGTRPAGGCADDR